MQPVSKSPQFGAVMNIESSKLAKRLVDEYKRLDHPVMKIDIAYAGEVLDSWIGMVAKKDSDSFLLTGDDARDLLPLVTQYNTLPETLRNPDADILTRFIKEKLYPGTEIEKFRITALNVVQNFVAVL